MKPTASFLAKLDRLEEFYSDQISKRCWLFLIVFIIYFCSISSVVNIMKQQYLSSGYGHVYESLIVFINFVNL